NPQKSRTALMGIQPLLRSGLYVCSATLNSPPARASISVRREIVVILKSTVQTRGQRFAIQNNRANESSHLIPASPKQLLDGRMSRYHRHSKVDDAMRAWQQSCHDRHV